MILLSWRADRTAQYIVRQAKRLARPLETLWFDDLCTNSDADIELDESKVWYTRWLVSGGLEGAFPALERLREAISRRDLSEVIGHPDANKTNFSKFLHNTHFRTICEDNKILLPKTILANNLSALSLPRRNLIVKGVSAQKSICTDLGKQHIAKLAEKPHALVQEKVDGPDIRVHGVGNELFAEMAVTLETDYRFAKEKDFSTISLPQNVRNFCVSVGKELRCPFYGIDLKLDWSGRWFFLEVNSSPAFQGYDVRAKGRILSALFDYGATQLRSG